MEQMVKRFQSDLLSETPVITTTPSMNFYNRENTNQSLRLAIISDIHLFPKSLLKKQGENFRKYLCNDRKMLLDSEKILDAAILKIIEEEPEVVLITGDLTKDSEKEAHNMLAKRLNILLEKGIKVFVINGNHDINNPEACMFIEDPKNKNKDKKVTVDTILSEDFKRIYSDYGYSNAIAIHEGSLSYVAQLNDGYRVIAIDSGTYGDDPSEQATEGYFRDGLVQWVVEQIKIGRDAGDEVIGMMHHGIIEHFRGQGAVFPSYLVKGWEEASKIFADAGMRYMFTGHFHGQDIASITTEHGNTLYDIMTGALATAPSPIRIVTLNKDVDSIEVNSHFIDKIEGNDNFREYATKFLKGGIPDMAISLFQSILLDNIEEEKIALNDILIEIGCMNPMIVECIKANLKQYNIDEYSTYIASDAIKDFVIAVTEEIRNIYITENIKLMDVIQYCLMEVYNGDEIYSDEMKVVRNIIAEGVVIPNAILEIINKHKKKLGIVGMAMKKEYIRSFLDSKVYGDISIGKLISMKLADLMDALLEKSNLSDNDLILYHGDISEVESIAQ